MIVDDAEISNFILKKLIQNTGNNYEVADFTDPVAAINSVSTINPSLIFLDLNMPVMSGFGFLEKMNELNLQYDVYVLTSSTSEIDKEKALQFSNTKKYLVKPLTVEFISTIL